MQKLDKPAFYISFGIFILLCISNYVFLTEDRISVFGFGYEYGTIAAAIAEGRGYSDVFGEGSGSTAWNLPLIVYINALFFKVFGVKSIYSIWALSIFKNLLIASANYVLIRIMYRIFESDYAYLVSIVFVYFIGQYLKFFTYDADDQPFFILIIALTILGIIDFIRLRSKKSIYLLCILSFVLPITIPTIGLALALILAYLFFQDIYKLKFSFTGERFLRLGYAKYVVLFAFIFSLPLSAWIYRNYTVFDKIIPSKSNMWYEFYMANVLDDDGVVSGVTFLGNHPFQKNAVQERYYQIGEKAFLEECEEKSKQFLEAYPDEYKKRVLNRIKNIFLFTNRPIEKEPIADEIKPYSRQLERVKLVYIEDSDLVNWISLNLDEQSFKQKLEKAGLDLSNDEAKTILLDWDKKKTVLLSKKYSFNQVVEGLSISIIPLLALITLIFLQKRKRVNLLLVVSFVMYIIHVLPYVFISHYLRYQRALLVMQSIFIFVLVYYMIEKTLSTRKNKTKQLITN